MEGFLTTHKGMEDIAALEVKELIGKNSTIKESCIIFNIKEYEDLFKLCYKSQSAIGIYHLLIKFDYNNIITDFEKNLQNIDLKEWLSKNTQFRVKCTKNYDDSTSTPELEKKLGEIIINNIQKKYDYKQKVNLENPEIIIYIYLTKKTCYVGIDFTGFDLSKRSYKILSHPSDFKGTIGYYLIRLSEYQKDETLLDTFSGSGTIPVEAALFTSNLPINFFNKEKFIFSKIEKFKNYNFKKFFNNLDKNIKNSKLNIYNIDSSMKNINYAKKNSKIAYVDKKINFSRTDIEWLDTKFKKNNIDKIVTTFPTIHKKGINNTYNEFFYQSEFILNKKGKIVLIGNKDLIKKYSSKYKFAVSDEKKVYSGKQEYEVFILTKK